MYLADESGCVRSLRNSKCGMVYLPFTVIRSFTVMRRSINGSARRSGKIVKWIKNVGIKYILTFFITLILLFLLINTNFRFLSKRISERMIIQGEATAYKASEQLHNYLLKSLYTVDVSAYNLNRMLENNASPKEIENYLVEQTECYTDVIERSYSGLYGIFRGLYVDGENWVPPKEYDPRTRPWYVEAIKNGGELALIEPYMDIETHTVMMSISRLLSDKRSVMALDLSPVEIQNITESLFDDDSDNISMVISSKGFIVSHSDPQNVGKNCFEEGRLLNGYTMDDVAAAGENYLEVDYNDLKYYVYFSELYDGWYAVNAISATNVLNIQKGFKYLEYALLIVILGGIIIFFHRMSSKNRELHSLNSQLHSAASIYTAMFRINLEDNTFYDIGSVDDRFHDIFPKDGQHADKVMRAFVFKLVSESYLEQMLQFTDLRDLSERMKGISTITLEFLSLNNMWCRGRFIIVSRNSKDEIKTVLWLIEIIDKEKRERERLAEERNKANEANQAKSSFLSNMSHEIRTPINAILGMNEMILRESHEEETLVYAENVRTSGNALLGIVNDILDFSKIEAGKMDIIDVDYDLASMLNNIVNMMRERIVEKGLEFIVRVDPMTPNLLHGDEVRIRQVITNLLSNAAKYTEKGSVEFTVGFYKGKTDKSILFNVSVKDTGIGIKESDIRRLFSAFERVDEKRNRNIEGTGLGLNITQRILKLMHSELEIDSVYGEGSMFSFSVEQGVVREDGIGDFETAFRNSLSMRETYKERFAAPDAKLLVVDDTPMNIKVFVSLLKSTKVQIDTAESGEKCLEMTREKKYDIIFLDHRMPNKDGVETLIELKADKMNQNLETPIICLTANAISGAREEYIGAGFDDYLTKPVNTEKLEEMIMRYLPDELVKTVTAEEEPDMKLPDFIRKIEELDTDAGIEHFGRVSNYVEMLAAYSAASEQSAKEIETLWEQRDLKSLTIKVHAVKSPSRAIGALKLADLAQILENAGDIGDRETLNSGLGELVERYRALGQQLSPLLERPDENTLPAISEEELKKAYTAIKEFIQMYDFDNVCTIVKTFGDYNIPDSEKERCKALMEAVRTFDYDKIPDILSDNI